MDTTCGAFLLSGDKLLACHPTYQEPGLLSIPKGLMEPGERFIDAMIREVFEETGLFLGDFRYNVISSGPISYTNRDKILYGFLVEILDPEVEDFKFRCESMTKMGFPEVDRFEWISISDARRLQREQYILFKELYKGWKK